MLKTLQRIAFERVGGSLEERKVFDILSDEVRSREIEPTLESFEVDSFKAGEGTVEVLAEEPVSFKVNPVGLSGNADVTGKARFVESAKLTYLEKAEADIILLLPEKIKYEQYKKLHELGISAFLLVNNPGKTPGYPSLKRTFTERFGKIPGAVISYEAGRRIISENDTPIHLVTQQEEFRGESHNLVATIPGDIADEEILLCAHADSVADSPGAVDNGAGCVELLGILGHFAKNRPKRTLRFCFFGSEELGLLGSQTYVEAHKDELDKIRLVINLDLGGDIFGDNRAIVTGPKEITNYIDSRSKLRGLGLKVSSDIYSSDNMPFAKKGIPTVSFGRSGLGASLGHSADDDLRNVDERSLRSMAEIALDFTAEMANAQAFPFKKEMPDDIAEKVDEYFRERMGLEKAA